MHSKRTDLTSPPDLTHERRTGPIRIQRPLYLDIKPPCNHACPAGENIQGWLSLATEGRYEEAWKVIVCDNPLPAVHGRVCYHPCESKDSQPLRECRMLNRGHDRSASWTRYRQVHPRWRRCGHDYSLTAEARPKSYFNLGCRVSEVGEPTRLSVDRADEGFAEQEARA